MTAGLAIPVVVAGLVGLVAWLYRRAGVVGRPPPRAVGSDGIVRVARARAGGWSRPGHRTGDPAALLGFRAALDRGASVVQAFESMAAGSDRWAVGAQRLVARVAAGAGVEAAMDAWVSEDADSSVRLLADALAISARTGGSQRRAVDAVIDAVRERAALQREVRALASQAHTSALVLVVLPIGFGVALAVVDPRVREFYVGSTLGPACVVVGCLLDAAGAWLMLRMVRAVA